MNGHDSSPKPKQGRGCLFYGCLTMVVLALIAGIAGYVGYRYVVNKVSTMVERYTDPAPAQLPTVEISSEELAALKKRVAEFKKAIDEQTAARTLTLTANEINALIVHDPTYGEFTNKFFVSIDGDLIRGQLSLPLDVFANMPFLSPLKGRYLNGAAAMKVSLENGVLIVTLDTLEVKGQALPAQVLTELRKQNLAKNLHENPESARTISKFERIAIDDGQVIITTKGPP